MKYKEIFTSWWFWVLVVVYAILSDLSNPDLKLSLAGYIGFMIGSALQIGIYASIIWGLIYLIKKIYTKIKNK